MLLTYKKTRNTITGALKQVVKNINCFDVNYLYANGSEAANILANDYSSKVFHDFVFPAIIIMSDIENESLDPRFESKFDLKIRVLAKSNINYTTEQKIEKVFEPVLYKIMDEFNRNLKRSGIIETPYVLKTIYKEKFNLQITTEVCDVIELDINDLKLIK